MKEISKGNGRVEGADLIHKDGQYTEIRDDLHPQPTGNDPMRTARRETPQERDMANVDGDKDGRQPPGPAGRRQESDTRQVSSGKDIRESERKKHGDHNPANAGKPARIVQEHTAA